MRKGMVSSLIVIFLLSLTGCINNDSSVLVSENVQPEDFDQIASTPEEGSYEFLVMKATDETSFNKLWDFYNFTGKKRDFEMEDKGAIFISTYESACESVVSSVKNEEGAIQIDIDTAQFMGGCEEIAMPRSFLIKSDKSDLKEQNSVVFMKDTMK